MACKSKFVSAIDQIKTNLYDHLSTKTNLSGQFATLWLVDGPKSYLKIQNMHKLSIKEYSQKNKLNNSDENYTNLTGQKV